MGLLLVFAILCLSAFSQSPVNEQNYSDIFGRDYSFALMTIEKNTWWTDTLLKDSPDPDFALAIIFPELIRYSSISDYIEVKGLEVLYVQYGRDYADFSVGLFQMKPSFAERIETDILKLGLIDTCPFLSALKPDTARTIDSRRNRIVRLKDEYNQLLYLQAFIRIMEILFPQLVQAEPDDRLIFCATAYNTGYFKDETEIRKEICRKRFYRGIDAISVKYSYSDISLDYYHSVKGR